MSKKILLSVPAETATGGIKNYFRALKNKFTLDVVYVERGARFWPHREGPIKEGLRFIKDIIEFRKKIRTGEFAIAQTSTSLGFYSIFRDGIFLWIAQKNKVKTIVFFRGWDKSYESQLEKKHFNLFKKVYFKADLHIVLSPEFKNTLRRWGYTNDIIVETTLIDTALLNTFTAEDILRKNSNTVNLLFLARTEVDKGIYETLNAYVIAKRSLRDHQLKLTLAGHGLEFEQMKNYILKTGISDVTVLGNVDGQKKKEAFTNAHMYIFPTYSEGMPNSVLEAMAFGLPIISSKAGAIPYIIEEGVNGFLTNSSDPTILASFIEKLVLNDELRHKISQNNFEKARQNYYSTEVIKRIEKIYSNLLQAS